MIRSLSPADLDTVMNLWLDGNEQAHPFVPDGYWRAAYEGVRHELPHADVLVHVDPESGAVDGFIGLTGDYVAGLFVRADARSRGIGKALLDEAKRHHRALTLHAYRDNPRAVAFYLREGFTVRSEGTDGETGAAEYEMTWDADGGRPGFCHA